MRIVEHSVERVYRARALQASPYAESISSASSVGILLTLKIEIDHHSTVDHLMHALYRCQTPDRPEFVHELSVLARFRRLLECGTPLEDALKAAVVLGELQQPKEP